MHAADSQPDNIDASSFTEIAPFYDALMAGVPYDHWVDYLEHLFRRHEIEPRTVLDIGCGTGAVALELARRGYSCCGVDLSAAMLEVARRNAGNAYLAIEYVCQDAAELLLAGRSFDAAVSLFDSLNNILDPVRLEMAFERAYHVLNSPGIFIFDVNTAFALESGMFNQRSTPVEGPLQYVWRSRYDIATRICTIDMNYRFTQADGRERLFHERHFQRAYSKDDILAMLERAGFDFQWCYDAYSFKLPRKRSDRVFFVASKGLTARPPYVNEAMTLSRSRRPS